MNLGDEGKTGVRISDLQECQNILDTFFAHGHTGLDTARIYAAGTTEQVRFRHGVISEARDYAQPPDSLKVGFERSYNRHEVSLRSWCNLHGLKRHQSLSYEAWRS